MVTIINEVLLFFHMKCEICKSKIEELFLEKIKGTYVKCDKGKRHVVCFECQGKLLDKDKILENL